MTTNQEKKQNQSTEQSAVEPVEVNYEEAIEAILFAAGHPITYDKLAQTFECAPSYIRDIVKKYAKKYNSTTLPRGVMLITFDDSCQLCTKEMYISYIRTALGIRKNGTLSTSSIETLAIIAYHQPVTRAYIDTVRGVDSSYAVTNLLERELISVQGRLDAPGRPMLYGTTQNFLRCFGLSSLSELPGEIKEMLSEIESKVAQSSEDPNQITIDEMLSTEGQPQDKATPSPIETANDEIHTESPSESIDDKVDVIDLPVVDTED